MRLKLVLIGILLLMMPNLASAMDQGCNPEDFTEKETHNIDKVTCAMDLSMHRNLNCNDSALSFKVAISGKKIPGAITMTCGERKEIIFALFVSKGFKYTCSWNINNKSYSKDFEWLKFGSRWQTCSYLKDWVEASAQSQ